MHVFEHDVKSTLLREIVSKVPNTREAIPVCKSRLTMPKSAKTFSYEPGHSTVDSRYLEFQGTLWNTSR